MLALFLFLGLAAQLLLVSLALLLLLPPLVQKFLARFGVLAVRAVGLALVAKLLDSRA